MDSGGVVEGGADVELRVRRLELSRDVELSVGVVSPAVPPPVARHPARVDEARRDGAPCVHTPWYGGLAEGNK
eukprot:CAMPEP_0181300708 /NCGR_PEP_ID=MMETSP1101-20121128/7034_1 /TAXON_ID=46948 /ORGANISM="Rhodomonas abbreviata, Strain Caron Lab Isolate" /LENGTH=72 /DNA_ID=CAMNT_0023405963 /DNA_START=422 /DNA_END=640 /DNA_ORIENTATION=-